MTRTSGSVWGAVEFAGDTVWLDAAALALANGISLADSHQIGSRHTLTGSPGFFRFGDLTSTPVIFPALQNGLSLAIASDVRLHNRLELSRLLGFSTEAGAVPDDAELVVSAYCKWQDDCPKYLLGEYAFAIFDSHRQSVFCCRDHMGTRPFYFWRRGSRFCFSSDCRPILQVPGIPRQLNYRKFSTLAAYYDAPDMNHQETFHEGILALPAGMRMTVDRDGLRQSTYWEPEVRENLVPRKPEEAFDALRQLLFQAVESRLPTGRPAAVYLSGGLDSSAVMSIAARRAADIGGSMLGISAVSLDDRRADFPDERDFIDQYSSCSNIGIRYVSAPGRGPFDGIENPDLFAAWATRSPARYLHEALESAAVTAGAAVVLQGTLGELGPSCWANSYYMELVIGLRWLRLTRELLRFRGAERKNPLRFLGGRMLDLAPGGLTGRDKEPPMLFLSPNYLRSETARWSLGTASFFQQSEQLRLIRKFRYRHAGRSGETPNGKLRVSQPLIDKRVLEFCLSAPANLKVRDGYRRYLVRGALNGVLPAKIQWRTDKMPFAADYRFRYDSQLEKAREFVEAIGSRDPIRSIIDVTELNRTLAQSPELQHKSRVAMRRVPATIYAICFLRQFAEYRP